MLKNFGQYICTGKTEDYMIKQSCSLADYETIKNLPTEYHFIDKAFEAKIEKGKNYFLHFKVQQNRQEQNLVVYLLKAVSATTKNKQIIKKIKIPALLEKINKFSSIDIIINAIDDFDNIVIELQRNGTNQNHQIIIEKNFQLLEIINILQKPIFAQPEGKPENEIKFFKKIGIQSTPGLIMVINGEEIRVGNSGFYEMLSDIPILSIGFVINADMLSNYFIMDYQY